MLHKVYQNTYINYNIFAGWRLLRIAVRRQHIDRLRDYGLFFYETFPIL